MTAGDGSGLPLAEAVRDAFFDRRTGILSVAAPGRHASLYFDSGNAFYCKSDDSSQRLDRVLVRWGLAAEEAVAGLVQRAGRDVRGGLVRQGVFPDEAAFDRFMAEILRERMADAFALEDAACSFKDEDVSGLNEIPFPTSTPNVLLEGVRRMADVERVLAPLRDSSNALTPNPRPTVPLESLALAPTEGYVLSQFDGVTRLADVASVSPLGVEHTLRLAYALLLLDVIRHPALAGYRFHAGELARQSSADASAEARDRAAIQDEYARVKGLDPFHVIPGGRSMSPEELGAAVRAYQARWSPGRFTECVARELREQLLVIAGRAGEALIGTLDAASRRAAGSAGVPQEAAVAGGDDAFRWKRMELAKSDAQARAEEAQGRAQHLRALAVEAMKAKDWHAAVELLTEAVRVHETAEVQGLLGDCLAQNRQWGKRAEAAYRRASQLEPFNAAYPWALARMYASHGLTARAREACDRVLELQPDHAEAQQALRELKRR